VKEGAFPDFVGKHVASPSVRFAPTSPAHCAVEELLDGAILSPCAITIARRS
jgi:hypothetical protein